MVDEVSSLDLAKTVKEELGRDGKLSSSEAQAVLEGFAKKGGAFKEALAEKLDTIVNAPAIDGDFTKAINYLVAHDKDKNAVLTSAELENPVAIIGCSDALDSPIDPISLGQMGCTLEEILGR